MHVLSLHVAGPYMQKKPGYAFIAVLEILNENEDMYVLHREFGPVIRNPHSPLWQGAHGHSYNTGKIAAMRRAVE